MGKKTYTLDLITVVNEATGASVLAYSVAPDDGVGETFVSPSAKAASEWALQRGAAEVSWTGRALMHWEGRS